MKSFLTLIFACVACVSRAQVDQIRSASSGYNSGGGGGGSTSYSGGDSGGTSYGSSFAGNLAVDLMFGGMFDAQAQKLEQRKEIPTIVSVDVMLQAAIQPSSYYIIHPRIRGNWGLFSTDFRFNVLVEESFSGYKHIRTNDWQIIQLNVITTRDFTARIGGGVMQEAFEGYHSFGEWTIGMLYQSQVKKIGGFAEYRVAEVRQEVNLAGQYRLFDQNMIHGFTTLGVVYQRYYSAITTWGIQAGFIMKIY